MMIAQFCSVSAGFAIAGCGMKNDRIVRTPMIAVSQTGRWRLNRDMVARLLGGHEGGEALVTGGLEDAADHDDQDEEDLHQVRALERPEQARLAREVRARGVELLADQRVVAGDDE